MPIERFHSVEEMSSAPSFAPGDPRLWAHIKALFAAARRLAPIQRFPGVYKHRSIEELNRQTEAWERANVRRSKSVGG